MPTPEIVVINMFWKNLAAIALCDVHSRNLFYYICLPFFLYEWVCSKKIVKNCIQKNLHFHILAQNFLVHADA